MKPLSEYFLSQRARAKTLALADQITEAVVIQKGSAE